MENTAIFGDTFLGAIGETLGKGDFEDLLQGLDPVEEGEEVVGEMTDLEKAIFSVAHKMLGEFESNKDCPEDPSNEDCQSCEKKKKMTKSQVAVLSDMGWQILKERLDLHGKGDLGIRQGCKIVNFDSSSRGSSLIESASLIIFGGRL